MSTEQQSAAEHVVDRTGWPAGEWDGEPDKLSWTDATTGLPCLIVRNRMGALCGYVAVDSTHRLYRTDYDRIDADIDVHGGLTYSDACQGAICHVPEPGKPDDVWWFGFDCLHSGDVAPDDVAPDMLTRTGRDWHARYRNVAYVRRECERLAAQLKAVA